VNSEAIIPFYAGILAQAVFLLLGRMELKDAGKILACCAGSAFGLIPGKHEHNYNLSFHLFLVACIFAIGYAFCFKQKILEHIDKEILLVWNLIGLYVALQSPFVVSHPELLILLLILSLIVVINAFAGFDKSYGWQVYFYIWFLCILVGIIASQFAFSTMLDIFGRAAQPLDSFTLFVVGMSFLYLAVNLWYLLELIPLPGKHQSLSDRLEEVEEAMEELAEDYDVESVPFWKTLLLLIFTTALLAANYTGHFISDTTLIPVLIVVLPVMDKLKLLKRPTPSPAIAPDNNP
jgi:hypothetical protein